MPSPHAVHHRVTATCHRSCHVFPVLPPTRPTSSRFATTPTPCHPTEAARALAARSLLIHSILSRRSHPGSRLPPPVHTHLGRYLAWLVTFLLGKTPNEVYHSRPPANEQPRIEPRRDWPRKSSCAKPQVDVDGKPGDAVIMEIDCHEGRRHLPIIRARRAA